MAEALGFEPHALLVEQTPSEAMLPLEEPNQEGGEPHEDEPSSAVH
jgi:hypothetical protein